MGLRQDILNEPIGKLELRELIAIRPNMLVRDAIGLLRRKGLGCAVCVDGDGKPLGKFTERRLIHLLLTHKDPLDQPVGDHLATQWMSLKITDPISKLLETMRDKGLRFVIVVDDDGKAVGLTGQKGLMEYVAEHFPRAVLVQPMVSRVGMNEREGA